jgi:hypothetical protein
MSRDYHLRRRQSIDENFLRRHRKRRRQKDESLIRRQTILKILLEVKTLLGAKILPEQVYFPPKRLRAPTSPRQTKRR